MPISDLIPWKKDDKDVSVSNEQERDSFLTIQDEMNRLFDEFFERPFGLTPFSDRSRPGRTFIPDMDVSETDKEFQVQVELPGINAEDVDVEITRNTMIIRGEKKVEKEEKGKAYYRSERSYGSFQRSIPLPEEVDEGKINATYQNGVLTVVLPKSPRAQKTRKKIDIKAK